MAGAERERWHFTLVLFLTQQDVVVRVASLQERMGHVEHFFLTSCWHSVQRGATALPRARRLDGGVCAESSGCPSVHMRIAMQETKCQHAPKGNSNPTVCQYKVWSLVGDRDLSLLPPPPCLAPCPLHLVWVRPQSSPAESALLFAARERTCPRWTLILLKDFMWCDKLWRCHNNMILWSKESLTLQSDRVAAVLAISMASTDPAAGVPCFYSSLIGGITEDAHPPPTTHHPPLEVVTVKREAPL